MVGVIVVFTKRFSESFAWYVTGVTTVPVNVGNGSNATVPSGFTVYVPSPGTVNEVLSQLLGVCTGSRPHNFTDEANSGKSVAPRVSFASGVYD